MKWFDAGVNLLDKRLDAAAIIARAEDAGVKRVCVITTHPDEWDDAAELFARYPHALCYTVGCHPHNAKVMTDSAFTVLEQHLSSPGVVAVGECGLDFNRDFSARDVQEAVFKRQLDLAVKHKKPVYLHERDALTLQLACLDAVANDLVGGISHCFTGDAEAMKAYISRGLYIGITGWLCDPKRGEALRHAVQSLPLERLIMETDAPYLFPKHHKPKSKNNEPAFLPSIGGYLAEILQLTPQQIAQISYANTCRLFGLIE
ncbi:TatD family hydrolase [Alteromonas sp. C1M14]|uniref:TatD family hydrolase n=1 Tax=Alteromonas sp. C1M14 TaxID=2841567 RepID=UPI001C0919E1|nr:TatD family hydrolase [Alteromonas sp. C1M14]